MEHTQVIKDFLLESFENLSNISDQITSYEKDPQNNTLLNAIYRCVHTLKGSAGFLGFKNLQELTHTTETMLDYMRDGKIQMDQQVADLLFVSFDKCLDFIQNIEQSGQEGDVEYVKVRDQIGQYIEGHLTPEKKETPQIDFGPADRTLAKDHLNLVVGDAQKIPVAAGQSEQAKAEVISQSKVQSSQGPQKVTKPVESAAADSNAKKERLLVDSIVKVNVNLLDKIMNVVGELVLNRNQILQYANTH